MVDLGFAVIRSKGRGKRGEVVDIKTKIAKKTLNSIVREEKVMFRPKWCQNCKKYYNQIRDSTKSCVFCLEKYRQLRLDQVRQLRLERDERLNSLASKDEDDDKE